MTLRTKKGERDRITLANEQSPHMAQDSCQLRGVIYARYSNGGNQTDQSLEGQVRDCRKYAAENNIRIVEEYLDAHISGKEAENRPAFQQMIADSNKHGFDVVIVWKTDRFARNRYDSARYKEHLKRNGITVRYAKENIPESAEGIILESMLEGMAEYYSADLAQKIERGILESAYKCKALTYPPMGYTINAEKHYEIDEQTAPLIRKVFEMYVRGDKLSDIASTVNGLGLRTKRGNPLQISSVTKIITNEKYIGVYEYKKGGIRIEDGIPALISKDLFYAAQDRYKAQQYGTYSTKNYGGSAKRVYPLAGIVVCGECGTRMYGETITRHRGTKQERSHSYYSCRCHRKKKAEERCPMRSITAAALEGIVIDTLKSVFLDEPIVDVLGDAVEEVGFKADQQTQIKALQAEKQKKERAIQNNLRIIDEGFCSDTIVVHLRELEADLAVIDREITYYKSVTSDTRRQLKWLLSNYNPSPEHTDEYWSDVIHCFINSVVCSLDGTISIQLKMFYPSGNGSEIRRIGAKKNLFEYVHSPKFDRRASKIRAETPYLHQKRSTPLGVFLFCSWGSRKSNTNCRWQFGGGSRILCLTTPVASTN